MAVATVPQRVRVQVTEADIARAHRNDSYKCVVAQAIARTLPEVRNIEVDVQSIRLTSGHGDETERVVWFTPYSVQGYVVAFDAGDEIHPFTFQLNKPMRVARRARTESGRIIERAIHQAQKKVEAGEAPHETIAAAYKAAKIEAPGPAKVSDKGGRKAPPRAFKGKSRHYGTRVLRINRKAELSE